VPRRLPTGTQHRRRRRTTAAVAGACILAAVVPAAAWDSGAISPVLLAPKPKYVGAAVDESAATESVLTALLIGT
jgi:hypothetical protein